MKNLPGLIILFLMISCQDRQVYSYPSENLSVEKFCFLGDVGKGNQTQADVAEALREEKCTQIYFLGDIIYPDGLSDEFDPQRESKFLKFYRPLSEVDNHPKLHILLGNHDYRGDPEAWIKIAKDETSLFAPSRFYAEKFGEVCLTSMDTNIKRNLSDYPSLIEQLNWINQQTKAFKDCSFKIALGHHPYSNDGHHGNAEGLIKDVLQNHILGNYDYYLAGHEHIQSYLGKAKNTHLLISGVGAKPDPGSDGGYITMEVYQDQKQVTIETSLKSVKDKKIFIELNMSERKLKILEESKTARLTF